MRVVKFSGHAWPSAAPDSASPPVAWGGRLLDRSRCQQPSRPDRHVAECLPRRLVER
jgi:hypothetical protein